MGMECPAAAAPLECLSLQAPAQHMVVGRRNQHQQRIESLPNGLVVLQRWQASRANAPAFQKQLIPLMGLIIDPIPSSSGQGLVEPGHQGLALSAELIDQMGQAGHVMATGEAPLVMLQLGLRPVEIIDGDRNHTRADLPAEITFAASRWGAESQHVVPGAAAFKAPLLQQAEGGVGHNGSALGSVHNSEPIDVVATHSIGKAIERLTIGNADATHARVAVVDSQGGAAGGEEGVQLHPEVLPPGFRLSEAVVPFRKG